MLTVKGLNAFYGRAHILFDLDIEVKRGEVVVLLGRNGAGKSTTMKAIMGLVPPASGEITFLDKRIERQPSFEICRQGMGYVPEERRIFTDLTVAENLEVGRQKPREGVPSWSLERLFELFPNLAERRNHPGGNMSGGEQQMLTIARTLMGNPAMILLDEPSEGLSPLIVEQMARTILAFKEQGLTVLLSEQNLHFAGLVSDRAYVIEKGRIRYQGTMDELARDEQVRKAYLSV
jgi:branched-chain amino acid transport system ATP-binding protein